jgi:hypothetical protein
MSYVKQLGGLFDPITLPTQSSDVDCLNKANASPQVVGIDAIITNLEKNWNPTGYYTIADVQTLIDLFADQTAAAGDAVAKAPNSVADAQSIKKDAFDGMLRNYTDRSQAYKKAIADAKSSGADAINAPALKDWVIASMRSISDAYVAAAVLQCMQGWLQSALDMGYSALGAIGGVVAGILGVAANLVKKSAKALDTAAGMLGFVIEYAPYAALGFAGFMLYRFLKERA